MGSPSSLLTVQINKMPGIFAVFSLLLFSAVSIHGQRQNVPEQYPVLRLGAYRVNRDFITLSGFSSGGSFAQQFLLSHSSVIHGIAVFSHTYYGCGPSTGVQSDFDIACTTIGLNSTETQERNYKRAFGDIQQYAARRLIENPRNLRNKPLYVYAGSRNWLFTTEMTLRIVQMLEPYIVNQGAIRTIVQEANLTLPTNRPEFPACIAPPNQLALSNCGLYGALDALQFLLGENTVRTPSSSGVQLQPLFTFDQSEFFYGIDISNPNGRHDMDSLGFMYVPQICQTGRTECLLHFYFHGCNVGRQFVGAEHIRNSGFLEVAETNGIIMVFPQVLASPENEIGCFDTYGVTGPLYATKAGAQVTVVRNMLARILREDRRKKTKKTASVPSQTSSGVVPESSSIPSPQAISTGAITQAAYATPPQTPNNPYAAYTTIQNLPSSGIAEQPAYASPQTLPPSGISQQPVYAPQQTLPPAVPQNTYVSQQTPPPAVPQNTYASQQSLPPAVPQNTYVSQQTLPPAVPQNTYASQQTLPPAVPQNTYFSPQILDSPAMAPQTTYASPQTFDSPVVAPQSAYDTPQTQITPGAVYDSPQTYTSVAVQPPNSVPLQTLTQGAVPASPQAPATGVLTPQQQSTSQQTTNPSPTNFVSSYFHQNADIFRFLESYSNS